MVSDGSAACGLTAQCSLKVAGGNTGHCPQGAHSPPGTEARSQGAGDGGHPADQLAGYVGLVAEVFWGKWPTNLGQKECSVQKLWHGPRPELREVQTGGMEGAGLQGSGPRGRGVGGGEWTVSNADEGVRVCWFRSLRCPRPPVLPQVTSQGLSLQLREGPVGLKEHTDPRITGAQSGRLIEVERSVSVGPGGPREGWGCPICLAPPSQLPTPPLLGRMQRWWLRRQLCRGSCSTWRGSWEACRDTHRSCCCRASGRRSAAAACRWVAAWCPASAPAPCVSFPAPAPVQLPGPVPWSHVSMPADRSHPVLHLSSAATFPHLPLTPPPSPVPSSSPCVQPPLCPFLPHLQPSPPQPAICPYPLPAPACRPVCPIPALGLLPPTPQHLPL